MGGTFQVTAGFQDSNIFQKAKKKKKNFFKLNSVVMYFECDIFTFHDSDAC